jgi:tetratricopeptide (TPR) repeat protein
VSLYESAVGKESRPVGTVLRDLALALRAVGRGAEAKPLFRRAITIMEREAPDSAALGLLWNNLGNLLIAEGDGSGATAAFETAISVYSRSHEPDSWGIAMPLLSFGDALRQAEEFDRARPFFERALLVDNQTFGEENENSAYTLGRLGELALAEGDLKKSRGLLERSLSMWMKSNTQGPGVTEVRGFIGRLLVAEGKSREALPHLLDVAARREALNGPAHPDLARALVDLASAQRAAEGPRAAEQTLAKALAIQRKALKAPHPALVATLNALGEAMVAQRRATEARPLIEESVRIARATLPERHSERLKAEGLLGRLGSS